MVRFRCTRSVCDRCGFALQCSLLEDIAGVEGKETLRYETRLWQVVSTLRDTIATYSYYVDFQKVWGNVDKIRVELNILNSLVGAKDVRYGFAL